MKNIEVASSIRGFLTNVFTYEFDNINFYMNDDYVYENTNRHNGFIYKLFTSKLADLIGIIFVKRIKSNADCVVTYNRIVDSNVPAYIIVENPTALYHYRLKRKNGLFTKYIFKKYLSESRVKGFICISEACYNTFAEVSGINWNDNVYMAYPLIPDCKESVIEYRSDDKPLRCLFVSSQFKLKGGMELLKAAATLQSVSFTIITLIEELSDDIIELINDLTNVNLINFDLNKEQMDKMYRTHDVLLNPTRQESFGLVCLEALKHGMPIISTNLYALKEMVTDEYNGFLMQARYPFFTEDNLPNPKVWNNRKNTIYADYIDQDVIDYLIEKIVFFDSDRVALKKYSENSFKLGVDKFGEKKIARQWETIFNK